MQRQEAAERDASDTIEPWEDLESQQIMLERVASECAGAEARKLGRATAINRILRQRLAPLEQAVERLAVQSRRTPPSRRAVAAGLLETFADPAAAAHIALQTMLAAAAEGGALTALAAEIGGRVEDEFRLRRLRRTERRLFDHLQKRAGSLRSYRDKRRLFLRAAERAEQQAERWSLRERALLGVKLVEAAIEATGLFECLLRKKRQGGRIISVRVVQATAQLTELLMRTQERQALLSVEREPMVCPPAQWGEGAQGGYLTAQAPRLPLVKTRCAKHRREVAAMRAPIVYRAINAAQNTAWRVNRRILTLQKQCLESGLTLGGLAPPSPAPYPSKPDEIDRDEAARVAWRRAARAWREEERRRASRALSIALAHRTAQRFSAFERIWLPHQYDFRGRLYPTPRLNPQGSDPVRALLEFSEGRPLGEEGWKWLAIHLANCGDFEKISKAPLAERVEWVFRNEERIRATAIDPLSDLFWTEADKPWQFLAACLEWSDYVSMIETEGEAYANANFLSRVAAGLDGACSGLQHFSLLLRDEIGGAAVNLAPSESGHDLYAQVAERVRELLERRSRGEPGAEAAATGKGDEARQLARAWLVFGVNRDLVKRPTMTFVYGARGYGYAEQVLADALQPRLAKARAGAAPWPFPDEDPIAPARFFAAIVAEAIEQTVVKAAQGMNWLQSLASEAAGRNLPLRWTTPDGFVAVQAYRATRGRMIHTTLSGRTLRLTLREETEALDTRRQRLGVSPNVIHSLDACHLRMTVAQAAEEGVTDFALVHDSFGVHAAQTPRFFQIIREAVVRLYEESDVASGLQRDLAEQLPGAVAERLAPPSPGELALSGVLEAEFAFA